MVKTADAVSPRRGSLGQTKTPRGVGVPRQVQARQAAPNRDMLLFPGFANSFHVVATPRGALRVAPVTMADVLVIQNKGGGHGEIGFHLAQHLVSRGDAVTILHEGDGPNPKEAHRAYGELPSDVKVIWGGDLSEAAVCLAKLEGASFSAVVDNWSKSPEAIAPYATAAKAWGVSNYAYVSSAGMYTPDKGTSPRASRRVWATACAASRLTA